MNPGFGRDFFLCLIMIKCILKRVLILIVPIVSVFVLTFLTFDEHKHCVGNEHRHVMGYMGFYFFSIFWFSACGIYFLIEIIFEFFKRRKSKD